MKIRSAAGRRRAPAAMLGAIALALSMAAWGPQAVAAPEDDLSGLSEAQLESAEQPGVPGVDEIRTSRNVKHVANVPKQAPFTSSSTWTDVAFQSGYAFDGNYDGFTIYDIRDPRRPKVVSSVLCPGSQNDISVKDNLLFLSTDSSRSDNSCASTPLAASNKDAWEGIKVFDISDKRNPRYIASVETKCGSHTHTLVPSADRRTAYLYVSSYSPNATFPDCQPPHDLISIVKVPLSTPTDAAVVATPNLFPDGGYKGSGNGTATSGCHDIT
ncbi:LVIVD repeat-containing protein, partial [Actinosynnema sp.]|uniref:LVIVD repeat-containing protein n=1 Tax=Actinosynnema sp. TaxID=1872144 RepID=UPI003F866540